VDPTAHWQKNLSPSWREASRFGGHAVRHVIEFTGERAPQIIEDERIIEEARAEQLQKWRANRAARELPPTSPIRAVMLS
jgi:hypothetical protein